MSNLLEHDVVVVKERVGLFRAANAYDLYDESGAEIGTAIEEIPNLLVKLLKFTDFKTSTPFEVPVKDRTGATILVIRRGWTIFRSRVEVLDGRGTPLGYFQQRLLSVGGKFELFLPDDTSAATVKGNLIGWDFSFQDPAGNDLGAIDKKWSGMAKELFTTADTYVLRLAPGGGPNVRMLLLAAALCVDMVLKERGR